MGYQAHIQVTLKPTINDPEGLTIANALLTLGFDSVKGVRAGKYIEVTLDAASLAEAERRVREMCEKLLANPVIERFAFEVEAVASP